MRKSLKRALITALVLLLTPIGVATTANPAQAAPIGDHVLHWNDVLLKTYRSAGGAPGPLARSGAMMHLAMYNAVNTINCYKSGSYNAFDCLAIDYTGDNSISGGWANPDVETAIDYAAHTVLAGLYPSISFTADLAAAQDGIPADAAQQQGRSIGVKAGTNMLSYRQSDGSANNAAYTPSTSPGYWRPTGSGNAATPNWGNVTMFSRASEAYKLNSLRPRLPGGYSTMPALLSSSAYASQVNEVKSLGRATGSTRTATQTQIAWFWANDLDGTYKPPGQLYAHTRIVSAQRGLDQMANLRLFALVAGAMADAGIASWDAKYLTNIDLWRPESAIQLAGTDGNAQTTADTAWRPLSADRNGVNFSPPFPAYVSGHATFGAAWARTMERYFGTDNISFTATTEDPHAVGVTRTFTSFSAAAIENARSRIYLGVHYQWDADYGVSTGNKVADYVTSKMLQKVLNGGSYPSATGCDEVGDDWVYAQRIYSAYSCRQDSASSWTLVVYPWP
ncbi:phosphatase PAP2 family protein [Micromonospora sp. NPDC094482]|uniref:vanadium-dependent haloperoxidase n=1 Tax=unclassified Micromonospora TaxID=2617518 RepID=UPI003329C07A